MATTEPTTELQQSPTVAIQPVEEPRSIMPTLDHNRYPWLSAGYYHLAANSPLVTIMEFLPTCQMCAVPSGNQYCYYQQEIPGHQQNCHRDILLSRKIKDCGQWKRIRHIPYQATNSNFLLQTK